MQAYAQHPIVVLIVILLRLLQPNQTYELFEFPYKVQKCSFFPIFFYVFHDKQYLCAS